MKKIRSNSEINNRNILLVFVIFSALSWAAIIILNAFSSGGALNDMLFGSNYFMDYFNSLCDASTKDVYKTGVIYPPLSCLMFYILSKMIPADSASLPFAKRYNIYQDGISQLQFLLFISIIVILLSFIIYKIMSDSFGTKLSFLSSLFLTFSFPMLYCIQRGNTALLSMVLSLFFVFYRNSENKAVKELAFISLAIAAGIKIYPAAFGVLLLFDKKYKDTIKLLIYGLVFFFVPFLFYGGIDALKDFIANNSSFSSTQSSNYAIKSTSILSIFSWFVLSCDTDLTLEIKICKIILFEMLAVTLIASKKEWQRLSVICFIFANLDSLYYQYILIFLILPFISFIKSKKENSVKNVSYFILFCVLLISIPALYYGQMESIRVFINSFVKLEDPTIDLLKSINSITESFAILIFEILIFVDSIASVIKFTPAKATPENI